MITGLRLENFKAFREADVTFAPLTLLSGVNAVGKSTVLQALAVVRQSFEAGILLPGGGLLLNGDYTDIGTGADLLHDDFAPDESGRPVVTLSFTMDEWINTRITDVVTTDPGPDRTCVIRTDWR